MREPPVKRTLYWCVRCDLPLVGKECGCGAAGRAIPLPPPHDVRPALRRDREIISGLIRERFGEFRLPPVVLLSKSGGLDRHDLVIMHGKRMGWLSFDPVDRRYRFDLASEGLGVILPSAVRGIVDLERDLAEGERHPTGMLGGKRFRVRTTAPDGTVIVKYGGLCGTGVLKEGSLRVKALIRVEAVPRKYPEWSMVVERNRHHLRNLERHAIRAIRQHMHDRPIANVSFSGGKDSMAVLTLARKAGVREAFFIDTGIEFPETVAFVEAQGVEVIRRSGDFWSAVRKAGPPAKDRRWCCKLLKLHPLRLYLAEKGACVTIQGNRWYESWNRAGLEITSQNPANPLQLNVSPIRNWRALEVYLYLWWKGIPHNPLYEEGIERIGCYLCPAMLESEFEETKRLHPELASRWLEFLKEWAEEKGMPEEYCLWGLWRWSEPPPKMRELCRVHGIELSRPETGVAVRKDEGGRSVEGSSARGVMSGMDLEEVRRDFPIVAELIYLDSAATSLSPEPVLEAILEFERHYRANVGRGIHRLSRIATQRYWHAHEKVARFLGGEHGVTVFTKNTTEAINMVARGLGLKKGEKVVTTILEHHSNLLPWMRLRSEGVELEIVDIDGGYNLDLGALERAITDETRLVAVTHVSNALGVINPVEEVARICRNRGTLLLIDGSQSAPHLPIDLRRIGADFFCCSGHKMLGPTGTGVLWMREASIEPSDLGGGIVESVTTEDYTLLEGYQRYEAGTPSIAGGIALGVAVDYLSKIGMERIRAHEERLAGRMIEGLRAIEGVSVYTHQDPARRIGVVSFNVRGLHPHQVAQALDEGADIMVRSGHHCCMPLMQRLGLKDGTVRASVYLYSTVDEVDALLATVREIAGGR